MTIADLLELLERPRARLPYFLESGQRGDTVLVRVNEGEVLVALDDVDETELPTAALSPLEAMKFAAALVAAAREAAG